MAYKTVKQISIQVENVPGKLAMISDLLGQEGVNIRAITVHESSEYSQIRFVADHPEKAFNILKSQQYMIGEHDVIALEIPDHPGGLNTILKSFRENNINVNYLYGHLGRHNNNAIFIMKVNNVEQALQVLQKNWVNVLGEEVYSL